jgi:hypothetical protein
VKASSSEWPSPAAASGGLAHSFCRRIRLQAAIAELVAPPMGIEDPLIGQIATELASLTAREASANATAGGSIMADSRRHRPGRER